MSFVLALLLACGGPSPAPAPAAADGDAVPGEAVDGDAMTGEAAASAAADAAATAERDAREAREVAEVKRLLEVARTEPRGAVEALLRIDGDWARAWACFLLVAALDDPARAAPIFDQVYRGGAGPGGAPSVEDALYVARQIGDDLEGTSEVPCWIAERWPGEWAEAFDAYYGSSRDIIAPMCAPPVDLDWWSAHHDAADRALGPVTGHCGTMRYAELRSGEMEVFRAWYVPRTLLDPVEAKRRNAYRELAVADLLERLERDEAAVGRYLAELRPHAAGWRRLLEPRLRASGLSRAERDVVLDRVTDTLDAKGISAALRCSREAEAE